MTLLKFIGVDPVLHCIMAYHPAVYTTLVYKEQPVLATFALIGKGILFSPLGKPEKSVGGA